VSCPAAGPGVPPHEEGRQGPTERCAGHSALCICKGDLSERALDPVLMAAASCVTTLLATPLDLVPAAAPLLVPDPGAAEPALLRRGEERLRRAIRALTSDAEQDGSQLEAGLEGE